MAFMRIVDSLLARRLAWATISAELLIAIFDMSGGAS